LVVNFKGISGIEGLREIRIAIFNADFPLSFHFIPFRGVKFWKNSLTSLFFAGIGINAQHPTV